MKVISGGQTGADQAGLFAARKCGIETGGVAPKGFRTQAGFQPELLKSFNLYEHSLSGYQHRTSENVNISDGTIRLAQDFTSAGEKCTLRYIKEFNKPFFDVYINDPYNPYVTAKWLFNRKIEVINIAGNSDGVENGKNFDMVYIYLWNVFRIWEELVEEDDG